tara:strand:- start:1978 stop:2334 length:357 start_codon:yes stop_codon:yes gene_type:complete
MAQLEYCNDQDRKVTKLLVKTILANGYSITVNDGEENTLHQSTNKAEILTALTTTGEDYIKFYKDDNYIGWFYLIYHNGSENDPMVVISNSSYNAPTEYIYGVVYEAIEGEVYKSMLG